MWETPIVEEDISKMTDTVVSIKVIPFSGKAVDWPVWSEKFLARADSRGYMDILLGTVTSPKDTDRSSATATAEEKAAFEELKQANKRGYIDLVLSIEGNTEPGRVAFGIVKGSKGERKPGDCHLAWQRLSKKYEPTSAPSRMNLRKKFLSMKLKTKEDPDVWLTRLEDLKEQLVNANAKMEDDDILEHALNNLPKEYEIVVAPLEKRLSAQFNPLTIEELREELNLKYLRLYGSKEESLTGESETALFAGGFKGKCNECGKLGHKARDCKDKDGKKNNNNNSRRNGTRFNGNCNYCKKKGHMEKNCFKKKKDEKDKDKGSESANVAKEKDEDLVLLALDLGEDFVPGSGSGSNKEDESSIASGDYMDDDFFDHFSSEDDFGGPEYDKENNETDGEIQEFFNSEGIPALGQMLQEPETLTHLLEYCNRTVRYESEEEDYDIAELLSKEEQELGFTATEILDDDDGEVQGPAPKIGRPHQDDLDFDVFHLGMIEYSWCHIPNPEGEMPKDPMDDWCLGDRYDPPLGWHNDQTRYEYELVAWKKRQLEIIQAMSHVELMVWKLEYKRNVERKQRARNNEPAPSNRVDFADGEIGFAGVEKGVAPQLTKFDHVYIGDSGASCHMTNSDEGMFDFKEIHEKIVVGNGQFIIAQKLGKKRGTVQLADGATMDIVLHNVKFVPKLAPYNLFSITQAIANGWNIGNKGKMIYLKKEESVLQFDVVIKTKTGWVSGVQITPRIAENIATAALGPGKSVNTMKYHDMLGHVSEAITRATARYYDIKLEGKFEVCADCAKAKARQKNVPKGDDTVRASKNGERLFFDISSIKAKSYGGAKFWLLVVDDKTDYAWSYFLKNKSDTPHKITNLIKHLKAKYKFVVSSLRCDNAGENKSTKNLCEKLGLAVKFEFTAPDTPQQNGRVERKFATLYGRVRAMLNRSRLPTAMRSKLWAEGARTATDAENLSVKVDKEKPPHKAFFGRDASCIWTLRRFGEIGIAKKGPKIKSKMTNPGVPILYLGHAEDHAGDVYRLLNLETKMVVFSRDVRWLNQDYRAFAKSQGLVDDDDDEASIDDSDDEKDVVVDTFEGNDAPDTSEEPDASSNTGDTRGVTWSNNLEQPAARTTRSAARAGRAPNAVTTTNTTRLNPKQARELARLGGTFYNAEADAILEESKAQEQQLEERLTENAESGETAESAAQSGRDMATFGLEQTIDQLFGDFALFVRDAMMESVDPEVKMEEPVKNDREMELFNQVKNSKTHLVDLLDATIRNDERMKESDRLIKLKHIVSKLKEEMPESFQEAYNHPDEKLRAKWRAGIRKEFHDMIVRKVWRNMKKKDVPKGRRCIKCRWVFDLKRNGIFRPRLVACGYSQVPGVDFTESYAPVINDVTWRILIVTKLLWKLSAKIVDVETAFLHGDLEEEIYMECPEGMGLNKEEDCVILDKSIYGLVQSARMYFIKFMKVLRNIGFVGGYADPCLMVRKNGNGVVYIAIWVDDSLLIGHNAAIEQTIKDLQANGFGLKIEGELDDYLSCEISFSHDKSRAWIHQPHLIKKIEKKFGPLVEKLQRYKTPGTPGGSILRNPNMKIEAPQQKIYRSGVGMLLYLVKHSRPDIANAVRELSKALDGTSPAAYKELLRVLKYVMDTKTLSLKIHPK